MTIDGEAPPAPEVVVERSPGRLERMLGWYMRRAARYSNRRFIVELLILSYVLKIAGSLPLFFLPDEAFAIVQKPDDMPVAVFVLFALVLAPVLETVIFQWFLLWVASLFTAKLTWRIGVSAFIFALAHVPDSPLIACAVFFPGLVFAMSFLVKRRESRWRGFWVTGTIHALHNVIALPLLMFGPS